MNSVERFHKNGIKRLERRFGSYHGFRLDADEEENNSGGKRGGGGGHGNTKIPFGLCQREGIKVDPRWTPKDAWDALADKGYTAGEVYSELKKTGKIEKRAMRTDPDTGEVLFERHSERKPKKLEASHFPTELISGTQKKNTEAFIGVVNDKCKDPDVSEFMSCATLPGGKTPPLLKTTVTKDASKSMIETRVYVSSGKVASARFVVPKIDPKATPEQREQCARVYAHELTHYIDFLARGVDTGGHFTSRHDGLKNAIAADDGSIGDEAQKLFSEFNLRYEDSKQHEKKERREAAARIVSDNFADSMGDMPAWFNAKEGRVDYIAVARMGKRKEAAQFEALMKKKNKEIELKWADKRRALMDGVSNLQGIYDSISGGKCRESGKTKYGHSRAYFKRDANNRAIEAIADYVALKATNPELAAVFERDKPEIAAQFNDALRGIVERMRGSK